MLSAERARLRRRRFLLGRHRLERRRRQREGLKLFSTPGATIEKGMYREVLGLAFVATRVDPQRGAGPNVGIWLQADGIERPLLLRIKSAQGVISMINDLFTIGWKVWPREFAAATGEMFERPPPPERPS